MEEEKKCSSLLNVASSGKVEEGETIMILKDEQHLANLGYKQEFMRHLGLFENWAATFTSMNFVSGIPVLFGWVMYTGGPKSAFANWTMVGGLSFIVSLVMAEIAAAFPTAGGIYFWSYRLGGEKWGPFLSWMTAWWNWAGWICVVPGVQQGATNFLLSGLQIQYPDADVLTKGWLAWLLTAIGMVFATVPNIISQRASGHFQTSTGAFDNIYNGINERNSNQASDSYCWVIGVLFGAWVFYGYDASAHLAEETHDASEVVAKGMWMSTLSSWLLSIPTLILILFCMQDFQGIISASYTNNWAEYLVQLIGKPGAVAVLSILWVDLTCATASCFMSAQRVTFAISRDGVLPFSKYFRKLNEKKILVHAAYLVLALSIAITCAVIGSTVAFSAITATATIATNFSYLIPICARYTVGRRSFQPAKWSLGRYSIVFGVIPMLYIMFLFVVLLLPQLYPVTSETLNYAPICIGIVTIISRIGWILPFGFGGMHWFTGPKRTIDELEHRD
ncbi:amino acid or gaba permease [Grosmannia clavigera kw1407]|uniref:Amino acid or gaba permease n=1 Tax=Grosmannia clavigera (strain kw1407 / UAMH 11150) TaxID=655863 RepID=F0XE22_GROCL|nr:amino acid or gaba permease [Grosmannia clavigera kw1407]EFX03654.1 amino acid or gaba permease [Grosmannia clavigera kw1407]